MSDIPDWGKLPVPPRTALVVIDMQNGFITPHTARLSVAVGNLLDTQHQRFATITATQYVNPPGSALRRILGWNRLSEPPETDLIPEVQTHADRGTITVHPKTTYSNADSLADHFGSFRPETGKRTVTSVYLCGVNTDICVLHTAVGLFERGFPTYILADGCGTNGGETAHTAALTVLERTLGSEYIIRL